MTHFLLTHSFHFALGLTALTCLFGCSDPEQQQKLEDALRGVQRTVSDAAEKLKQSAPAQKEMKSMAEEELNKLSAIEYHVTDFSKQMSSEEMKTALSTLGEQRWQCSNFIEVNGKIRVFCNRRPASYLRYLQRFLPSL